METIFAQDTENDGLSDASALRCLNSGVAHAHRSFPIHGMRGVRQTFEYRNTQQQMLHELNYRGTNRLSIMFLS